MTDTYSNFSHLCETNHDGVHFNIIADYIESSPICIVAPHAGKIEFFTSEISRKIAKDRYSLYLFEGIKTKSNSKLHITSSNFDEPQALEIVEKHPTVLGIHGCKSKNCSQDICIGGLDEPLKQALATQFDNFDFRHTNTGHQFPAQKPSNICNLGTRKMGAQLELRHDFRKNLRNNSKLFEQFISAVRNALAAFSINIVPMDSNQ